ncbi:hypothetical protein CCR75_000342 [Bremia lactucae]|uniref:RING-type E3 ubiquitin transferase n=1 Tax=Bremia lactucae TaxID=4779 RepID=A0A976IEI3_BRELC|nr:hypothetical protein CCR75_000342 [Bremia lactucae]
MQFYGTKFYIETLVSPFTACEPLRGQDLTGKVALVLRGDCNFVQKVWHAQRAHAAAVIVMDNELRHEPPSHIIMTKDDMANTIHIPAVFISYVSGEWLLDALSRATPWKPLQVSLNSNGELPRASPSYRVLKLVVAFILSTSSVCTLSIGLSLLSSVLFQWVRKIRRTRVAKKLPIAKYERNMQRTLLEHLLKASIGLDRVALLKTNNVSKIQQVHESKLRSTESRNSPHESKVAIADGEICRENERKAHELLKDNIADMDAEICTICLDDFEDGVDVKVLPCQHFFHVNCINPWLEGRSGSCPLCKQDAIASSASASKRLFGIILPRIDQIFQQEHWAHTIFFILPASLISCLIVNAATAIIYSMWP